MDEALSVLKPMVNDTPDFLDDINAINSVSISDRLNQSIGEMIVDD